ncbi:MAG: rod shape-determining protein MreC [Lachnospiraceae bacterium]|nr:rod shape-determining protein MreC [Lachnospiraceae bacterium]
MRRDRRSSSATPKVLVLALSVLCLVLIFVSYQFADAVAPVKNVVGEIVFPMQKGINLLGSGISGTTDYFTSKQKLLDENKKMKEELDSLKYQNGILQQDFSELDNLRELYSLDDAYSSYPTKAARIISRDSNNWYNQFTIDKGTGDGIAVNMNVIANGGLVGIVTDAGKHWAKVRAIIDDKSNVSGMEVKNSDICNVKGNLKLLDSGNIILDMVDVDAAIKEGDTIVTSNISDKFLPGITIGTVTSLNNDDSNMTKSGEIKPVVSFDSLKVVLVITTLKEELPKEALNYN